MTEFTEAMQVGTFMAPCGITLEIFTTSSSHYLTLNVSEEQTEISLIKQKASSQHFVSNLILSCRRVEAEKKLWQPTYVLHSKDDIVCSPHIKEKPAFQNVLQEDVDGPT